MRDDGATAYTIRPGRPADADRCAALNDAVHPHTGIGPWTRDLFDNHPSVRPADFLVAEHTGGDGIVATLVAIRQEWTFGGVRLPVSQVELVGTDPAHRGRQLAGRLLHALHTRCSADGTALQVIEGIPYFYRRFGYEYALHVGGAPDVPLAGIRELPEAPGPLIRPATPADAPALARVDRVRAGRDALTCPRDERAWLHEISGHRPDSLARRTVKALVDPSGEVNGYVVHGRRPSSDGTLPVLAAAYADPDAWPRIAPALLRHLAEANAPLWLLLPASHPLARHAPPGTPRRPRAWYARTESPATLLNHVLPALARRWRDLGLRCPGDTMTIDTYHEVIRLHFTAGAPATAQSEPRGTAQTDARIPPGALLQMLLGHRTPKELTDIWPDMTIPDPATAAFLEAAFPVTAPEIWAVA
ncbi:GNAT family N-acetyltransferase [Streptomyces litchfieldiae]|uniref:GNAT family N-acetyltransferase n=1 Tax=Streptomyces litchfieldiae TaxID=3075543 RepID=A0ABU2MJS4_9ACTN|nr:GNAT family N-acetyltransferase [Streptomyces sp. DSM 44938]MDT0341856.1 GNAT family N-acetyltransferase [Streptomyces sp. DSM 44938]